MPKPDQKVVEINAPTLGESVTEATVAKWFKAEGDTVTAGEGLLELETDKITCEVEATTGGILDKIAINEGQTVKVGALLGLIGVGSVDLVKSERRAEISGKADDTKMTEVSVTENHGHILSTALNTYLSEDDIPYTNDFPDDRLIDWETLEGDLWKTDKSIWNRSTRKQAAILKRAMNRALVKQKTCWTPKNFFNEHDFPNLDRYLIACVSASNASGGSRLGWWTFSEKTIAPYDRILSVIKFFLEEADSLSELRIISVIGGSHESADLWFGIAKEWRHEGKIQEESFDAFINCLNKVKNQWPQLFLKEEP